MLQAIGSKKDLELLPFYDMISDLLENETVQSLKQFRHHVQTTRFQHSLNVAYYNYIFCKRFGWDARSAARAGMLHDLFFYNRKEYIRKSGEAFHNKRHPQMACSEASQLFTLSTREKDIILKHMWPMTPTRVPRYKESMVIVLTDKYCALLEVTIPLFRKIFRQRSAKSA